MKWLTNAFHLDVDETVKMIKEYNPQRRLYIGIPKATEMFSEKELTDMGMVGIFETEQSTLTSWEIYDVL